MILGAAKCGTTSLSKFLSQHPDICMSDPKEPLFFEAQFELGAEFYSDTYFAHCRSERERGDARHRNLYLPFVLPRIQSLAPDSKFLVIVRHPIDRAYSHWWHWYSRGVEESSFEAVIERNFHRLAHGPYFDTDADAELYRRTLDFKTGYSRYEPYVDHGYYAEQISRYQTAFGVDRVKILFFEDFSTNPQNVLNEVFTFLGVPHVVIKDTEARNIGLSKQGEMMIRWMRALPGKNTVSPSLRLRVRNFIATRTSPLKPQVSPEIRTLLVQHFEPHTLQLERMTGRVLSNWRK